MAEATPGAVAPVETPPGGQPVIAPDLPTGQENATPPGEESVKPPKTYSEEEHRKGISERLSKERRRLERTVRAEAERDYLKRELEQRDRTATQANQPEDKEPDPKAFSDFDSWNRAQIAYHVKRGVQEAMSGHQKETVAQQNARMEAQRGETLRQKFAAAEAKYPDFRDVLADPDLPFNGAILAFIEKRKAGGDVAYRLANDRDEFARIAALDPMDQVEALLALEAKISAPPQQTKTPPPIVPNGGAASVKKDWGDMTTAEHVSAYHKRKRR